MKQRNNEWLPADRAAELVGIERQELARLVHQGKLKSCMSGGKLLIFRTSLAELAAKE
jgi:excisionase family DNA binding protein